MLPVSSFFSAFTRSIKIFILFVICFLSLQNIHAQKVTPVTKSPLTGINLPAGSKSDKRMLSVGGAQLLLNMEAKKTGAILKNTEVLYLPVTADNTYTIDIFTAAAKDAGWEISAAAGEKEYYWLQQNGRYILMCFDVRKKEIDIYFAESNQAPGGSNTTTQVQNDVPQQNNSGTQQPTNNTQPEQQAQNQPQENPVTPAISTGFKFSTTNFDDGWTATEQADWVEVIKGSIKVLLHYPKEGTIFPADPEPLTSAAWNILVAPHYSSLKNYKTAYINTYNRPYLGMGYATENSSGKEVFVVLFRQGQTGWLEFVAPDKASFIEQYKFDPEAIRWDSESELMNPLANMTVYNKFAMDASDFKGKWTSDFTGIQQLYNVYTGDYAGMHMNQSNEEFIFGDGGTYNWKLLVINGMAGNAKFAEEKSSGTLSVPNNWQVYFTKIESGPKTFHAFWSCIKGARILNLLDAQNSGSGIYTKYGLAK